MTSTDRAFIAALQQASATSAPGSPAPEVATPHFAVPTPSPPTDQRAKRRAPLSEHLVRRRQAARAPFRPGIETLAFAWPIITDALASQAGGPLQDVIDTVTRGQVDSPAPTALLFGAQPAVGTTTTLLAIARIVSKMGGRVAILDLGGGAAAQLGVRRPPSEETLVSAAIDHAVVASRADSVAVLTIAPSTDPGPALGRLTGEHDLVLVDGTAPITGVDHTLLIDAADGDPGTRAAAMKTLATAEISLSGVIETLG